MPPVRTPKHSAGALTKGERAKLAKEFATSTAAPVTPHTTEWDRLYGSLMRDRDHLEGCPGADEAGATRVEVYSQAIPPTAQAKPWGGPGDTCTTVRCQDCGGFRLLPGTPNENIASALELDGDAEESDETL